MCNHPNDANTPLRRRERPACTAGEDTPSQNAQTILRTITWGSCSFGWSTGRSGRSQNGVGPCPWGNAPTRKWHCRYAKFQLGVCRYVHYQLPDGEPCLPRRDPLSQQEAWCTLTIFCLTVCDIMMDVSPDSSVRSVDGKGVLLHLLIRICPTGAWTTKGPLISLAAVGNPDL